MPTTDQIRQTVAALRDPVVGKPLGDLGAVSDIRVSDGHVHVGLLAVLDDHPLTSKLSSGVRTALSRVEGVDDVVVQVAPMNERQRAEVAARITPPSGQQAGHGSDPAIPFNDVDSNTKVLAIASGKGGVGKSSITTNLAVALAAEGYEVGVLDADVWGYSIPRMLGVGGRPVAFANRVIPLLGHGVKVISIGFFLDEEKPVVWRGPMLHRSLQQFLADVLWGDLDFLLCDLPPGTGDIAISLAQMLPNADMLLVTTPQEAAQRVALRAGQATAQTGMRVAGVIENMATFVAPDTGKEYRIFGEGGGHLLAAELNTQLLGSIPIDQRLRAGADAGVPLVVSHPDAPAAQRLREIAAHLVKAKRSLVGKSLPLQF